MNAAESSSPNRELRSLLLIAGVVLSAGLLILGVGRPGYWNAQPRAKLSRAVAEIRMLTDQLAVYRADNGAYPEQLGRLLQGVNYIEVMPSDSFRKGTPPPEYGYYLYGNRAYILTSYGPDGDSDIEEELYTGATEQDETAAWKGASGPLRAFMYDLSNGVRSDGDILEVHGIGRARPHFDPLVNHQR